MRFQRELLMSKYVEPADRRPIDTLFLIGNGFDRWQGLDTSYDAFESYYHAHLEEVLKRLGLKLRKLADENGQPIVGADGKPITYSDVELFYGDPGKPGRLPHIFWGNFEASLDKVDDQELNYFFGRTGEGIRNIQACAKNADRILREIFGNWIRSISLDNRDGGYRFGEHSLFVNFNYTETLVKRFGVNAADEFHIHGEASDKNSIIFGHAAHPELAYDGIPRGQKHPRYEGLYYIEDFLYHSDKHIDDNYLLLKMFLGVHGVSMADIRNIYVLGLGFGDADLGYIHHLIRDTGGGAAVSAQEEEEAYLSAGERCYLDAMDWEEIKILNINYASKHRERILRKEPIRFPEYELLDQIMHARLEAPYYHMDGDAQGRLERAVVRRRFWEEQKSRDDKMIKEYLRMLRKKSGSYVAQENAYIGQRNTSGVLARWHISYFSEADRERIDCVMRTFGCESYELHPCIDRCISRFQCI